MKPLQILGIIGIAFILFAQGCLVYEIGKFSVIRPFTDEMCK